MKYTADFETTTDEKDCRVWAFAVCSIDDNLSVDMGNNIDDFMEFCFAQKNADFYFHNLKFDGIFLLCWLYEHGYAHILDRKEKRPNTFTTLINTQGQYFNITVYTQNTEITFLDSMKLLPFSIEKIAKDFKLPIAKKEIDYHLYRPKGHNLTREEQEYIKNDVKIAAMALKELFAKGLNKMTTASNALQNYKTFMERYKFERLFPEPVYDHDIRQAYKGGYTYVVEKYRSQDLGAGLVYDVNSLYPSVMGGNFKLPYGEGKFFEGQYKKNNLYCLYIQMFSCQFELKPGYLPIVQLKGVRSFFQPTEYLSSSLDETVFLCMTSVDLKMFLEHYEVYNINYISGWMFKGATGLFTEYVTYWNNQKIEAKKEHNNSLYVISKLMLNSLYGKFALNPDIAAKIPVYLDGKIAYKLGEVEHRKPIYLPVSEFITAYARQVTITACQANFDRLCYTDTDSIHLLGLEPAAGIEIDPYKLGAWKHEFTFDKARFIRAKRYMEIGKEPCSTETITKIICSGMPASCHEFVTWENFRPGQEYPGKLISVNVKGGVVLKETKFTLMG